MNKLQSDELTVLINPIGAELWSIIDKNNEERLWQGNPEIWEDKAPNLFPFIARLTNGSYTLNGDTYKMDTHGFAKSTSFSSIVNNDNSITFQSKQNSDTKNSYPYDFDLDINYKLEKNKIIITYSVKNNSEIDMYFGIGGHPGFIVPLCNDIKFSDYYLEFDEHNFPTRIGFTEDCYLNGDDIIYNLLEDKKIILDHKLFDDDAIVLKNTSKSVALKCKKNDKEIIVNFDDFEYLGLWQKPGSDACYICIEPWSSLPSRKDIVEEFTTKSDLICLEPSKIYKNTWSITIK